MINYIMLEGKQIPISDETANSFKEQFAEPEKIDCPIQMEFLSHYEMICIPFNGRQQSLYFDRGNKTYIVTRCDNSTLIPCTLTPCEREDLKTGDTAFRSDLEDPMFVELCQYCKILSNDSYAWVTNNGGVSVDWNDWNHWWKVEPKN